LICWQKLLPVLLTLPWIMTAATGLGSNAQSTPFRLSQQLLHTNIQGGNQVSINGRFWPADWSQWPSADKAANEMRLGVSDASLMQLFGVRLLNTADSTQQPVEWFSDLGTEPLLLATQLTPPYRYLDITELAQRLGWQVQTQGSLLKITTPPAQIEAVRRGKQLGGERLVVNLDRSAPWQMIQQGSSTLITLDAQIPTNLVNSLQSSQIPSLIQIKPAVNQTILEVNNSSIGQPHVWMLPNPDRLIIDTQPTAAIDRDIAWAPGLRWRQQTWSVGTARFPVIWLDVDPRQSALMFQPIWSESSTLVGTSPLPQMAQRWQAIAAINGGFFNRDRRVPLGAIRQQGRWISGPILNRGAIAWDEKGRVSMGRLSLQETLITSTGQRLLLQSLNSGYVQAGIARYTRDWGATYTPITNNEIIVAVQNNQITQQDSVTPSGEKAFPIPAEGYLLVLRSNQAATEALIKGSTVNLISTTAPVEFSRYPYILGAGPLLLLNGQIVLDPKSERFSDAFIREKAVRSAIGRTADGHLVIATVQQQLGGDGPTLSELAQLMRQLGALDALNLDGGSSTTLYLGGQLLNRPAKSVARVHNGIGLFVQSTAPPIFQGEQFMKLK
jgi:hypothetical protein